MRSRTHVTLVLALSIAVPQLFAADYYTTTVSPNTKKFDFSGGESQSAVVPPGKKSQCPNGRFLVSDDWRRPPLKALDSPSFHPEVTSITADVVHWRNLGAAVSPPNEGVSTFSAPPNVLEGKGSAKVSRPHRFGIWGADHRLVSMPNGDLIYQRLMGTREPMVPDQPWAGVTARQLGTGFFGPPSPMSFGPGARSSNGTWLSTDCGTTFEYAGEIDSFGAGHEDCANPQPLAGSDTPPFDMGGTDNSNLVVDRKNGTVYAVIPCFGNVVKSGPMELGDGVNKTYVFAWKPASGQSMAFTNRGSYNPTIWGAPAVALSPTRFAVAAGKSVAVGTASSATGKFTFPAMEGPDGVSWGWDDGSDSPPDSTGLNDRVSGNVQGSTLLAHMPGFSTKLLFAFPSKIGDANGFRVFFVDPDEADIENRFTETDPIVPTGSETKSVIMHLTAADPGDGGPVLLYWYDLFGGNAMSGKIRGRVIYSSINRSDDFDIGTPFSLTQPGFPPHLPSEHPPRLEPYFYGDYKTAEAFRGANSGKTTTYRYFPMWVQPWTTQRGAGDPGGSVHYGEVKVTITPLDTHKVAGPAKDKPEEMVFGECCDFISMLERVEKENGLTKFDQTGKTADQAARIEMARQLLTADSNLRDSRLRVSARKPATRQARRAVRTASPLSPAMRKNFEKHRKDRLGATAAPRP